MRVILREDVDNLGNAGEIVGVRDGYSRNFLFPRGLASPATEKDVARVEHERRIIAARQAKLLKDLELAASKLAGLEVSLARASGEESKLYGSVTNRDIATALKEKGYEVDAKRIVLKDAIKTLGQTDVTIKLGKGIVATVKVTVVKQED